MQMKKMLPVLACALVSSPALALNFIFEYDADSNFFTDERRAAIERAASVYERHITNDLNVFVFLGSSQQEGSFAHSGGKPSQGWLESRTLEEIAMSWEEIPSVANFQDNWMGFIFFNEASDEGMFSFYSGTDESFSGIDIYTTALHELGHVLGFGSVDTWWNNVSGDYFYGKNAVDSYGGPVPLFAHDFVDARFEHWLPGEGLGTLWIDGTEFVIPNGGVESTLLGTEIRQPSVYGPTFGEGTRLHLTDLDLAGLQDIGWATAVPEPATMYMLLSGLGIVGLGVRRRRCVA